MKKTETKTQDSGFISFLIAIMVLFLIGSCTVNMFTWNKEDSHSAARYWSQ